MSKTSKITVKHYLNTNLKPVKGAFGNEYKVYFLLRYLNQNTKIKSLISNTFTEDEFSKIEKDDILNEWIKKEIIFCENIIQAIEQCGYTFDIKTFMQFFEFAKYPILENFDEFIKWSNERIKLGQETRYERQNSENYLDCFAKLKKEVYNNKNYINNELYLGSVKEIRKLLKINIELYEVDNKEKDSINYFINPVYNLNKYTFIDFYIEVVLKKFRFKLPNIDILPPKIMKPWIFQDYIMDCITNK
jgi:hypothetical protein